MSSSLSCCCFSTLGIRVEVLLVHHFRGHLQEGLYHLFVGLRTHFEVYYLLFLGESLYFLEVHLQVLFHVELVAHQEETGGLVGVLSDLFQPVVSDVVEGLLARHVVHGQDGLTVLEVRVGHGAEPFLPGGVPLKLSGYGTIWSLTFFLRRERFLKR